MTDFRALCEELVAIEDALSGGSVQFSNQGQALDGYSALATFRDVAARARAALAEQSVGPTPIPVANRLPGSEDCDTEGRCWWFDSGTWIFLSFSQGFSWGRITHWLPANALPVPAND